MRIGVPKESFRGERRVALVPDAVVEFGKIGLECVLEHNAGAEAGFPDAAYVEKGARIAPLRPEVFRQADIVVQVRAYGANLEVGGADLKHLRRDQVVVGFCEPLSVAGAAAEIAATGATLFAMELIPRIARAQSMDALSSMATIAGYKAVLLAAERLTKMFPMMMTAAGTITPARVLVIGAGVAGLQAIATSRRLGAVVWAYDLRPAVKEQVESLGARFIELPLEPFPEDEGGYAKGMGDEFYRRQRELLLNPVASSDVVITTAAVPGRKAPLLVSREMVKRMRTGSVIVDLAAEQGGNCEVFQSGEMTVEHGVTILAPLNLPSTVPYHASQMYSRNMSNFLRVLIKDGRIQHDSEDAIIHETLVTRGGEVVHAKVRELLGSPSTPVVCDRS